jgi:hypothetical protein
MSITEAAANDMAPPPAAGASNRPWPAMAAAAGAAIKAFALTIVVAGAGGLALGLTAWALVADRGSWLAVGVAVLTLVECAAAGVFLAAKRGVLQGACTAVRRLGLTRHAFALLLAGLRRAPADGRVAATAQAVGRGLERLPLDRAEARLRETVSVLVADNAETGWLRRLIRRRLLALVAAITLAHLRTAGGDEHGVNLVALEQDLGTRIDRLVLERLTRSLRMVTLLVLFGLVAVVALQVTAVRLAS